MWKKSNINRKNGILVAALTNNWYGPEEGSESNSKLDTFNNLELYDFLQQFDVVVESRVVKMRKPDPHIYTLACDKLGVKPSECVYLDGIPHLVSRFSLCPFVSA